MFLRPALVTALPVLVAETILRPRQQLVHWHRLDGGAGPRLPRTLQKRHADLRINPLCVAEFHDPSPVAIWPWHVYARHWTGTVLKLCDEPTQIFHETFNPAVLVGKFGETCPADEV
jgi:hypothetical protein